LSAERATCFADPFAGGQAINSGANDETHSRTEAAEDYRGDRMFLGAAIEPLGLPRAAADRVRFEGPDSLPSTFPVTAFASAAIGAAALAVSELVAAVADAPPVTVDRRLASLWFGMSIKPVGWTLPLPWDSIAGDYPVADGWVRLHTNAPRHRTAALRVLNCAAERSIVAEPLSAGRPRRSKRRSSKRAVARRRCGRSRNGGLIHRGGPSSPSH
jgi:hypothetical protein